MTEILAAGSNCHTINKAERLSFLVEAEEYFRTVREAIKKAEKAVYILSWDIDSTIALEREEVDDGYPVTLGAFLDAAARKKPDLEIYILNWDFAVLYMMDREFFPMYKLGWKTHRRVHFRLDDYLPEGASQHQKVVVIDDALAFVGGLDLTRGRWDTSEHLPFDERRDRIENKICRPYHDVQVMAGGDCARQLGEMARQNWRYATGKELPVIEPGNVAELWPDSVPVDIQEVTTALSFTYAPYKERRESRQIKQFYRDAILAAKKYIYMENQYFTAPLIGEALRQQLEKEEGPEIVLVTAKQTDGWLSQHTMDVLRLRLIRRLKERDKYDRFRVYYPDGPGLDNNPINVHAKLMVVDDCLVTVGSANLNNRSMALDNECNVVVQAGEEEETCRELAGLRNRLLAEHLGCDQEKFAEELQAKGSLLAAIEALQNPHNRHLEKLPMDLLDEYDLYVPDVNIIDPEHPIELEKMIDEFVPEENGKDSWKSILFWLGSVVGILFLVGLWRWTPLREWVNIDSVADMINQFRHLPSAPVLLIALFVVAGLVSFPLTVLVVATIIAFGSLWGFVYSLTGAILSAITTYGIGYFAGRDIVRKLAGERLNRISKRLAHHGKLTVAAVRVVPLAPFTIVNMVAGASHINFRDYVIGSILGMAPGMLAIAVLKNRAEAIIRNPNPVNAAILVTVFVCIAVSGYALVRWLRGRVEDTESSSGEQE